jgi:hypothetical protein
LFAFVGLKGMIAAIPPDTIPPEVPYHSDQRRCCLRWECRFLPPLSAVSHLPSIW